MPHVLIARLTELEQVPFQAAQQNEVLGEGTRSAIPTPALDLLDQITDAARAVFVRGNPPTRAQEHLMNQRGFALLWRSNLIRTKKGLVRY